jgi:hypothetical protein
MRTRRVTVVAILAMLVGLLPGSIFAVPSQDVYEFR